VKESLDDLADDDRDDALDGFVVAMEQGG